MTKMRKIGCLVLALAMGMSLAGCGGSDSGTIRIGAVGAR